MKKKFHVVAKTNGKEPKTPEPEPKNKSNTVFIGHRPMRDYLMACLTSLASGNKSLVLKARGQAITTCVDTVEVLKRNNPKVKVDSIILGTEEIQDQRTQRKRNVSTMEITVST